MEIDLSPTISVFIAILAYFYVIPSLREALSPRANLIIGTVLLIPSLLFAFILREAGNALLGRIILDTAIVGSAFLIGEVAYRLKEWIELRKHIEFRRCRR